MNTPLLEAIKNKDYRIGQILIEKGSDFQIQDKFEFSSLDYIFIFELNKVRDSLRKKIKKNRFNKLAEIYTEEKKQDLLEQFRQHEKQHLQVTSKIL